MESSTLLVNLAVAIAAALVGAAVSVRAGLSPVVGYIVAGVAIGPFTPGFVGDTELVGALADIGVIFLMFAIGGQISLPDLRRVGAVAVAGGTIQVLVTIGIGAAAGLALGWGPLESVFLGAVVSNSSSTVLTKVLGERGELDAEHGHIALGWSTVQDLGTIVLIVVLSALAGDSVTPESVAFAIGESVVFLVIVLPVGTRVVPRLFEFLASFRSREIFILGVVAMALGTAYAGSLFGISLALGAFLAGILVAESDLSYQVVGEALPFRDLFAGLFFVSVGMLVDPAFIIGNPAMIVVAIGLIVLVKGTLVAVIARLFRYRTRTAVLTGIALAQSAEFSFLLARVGTETGAVGTAAFNLMLTGAAASIVLAPALARAGGPIVRQIEQIAGSRESGADDFEIHGGPAVEPGRRHAVICGYGRVGRLVASALERRGLEFVVVELDGRAAREAVAAGRAVVRGPAENPAVLEQAVGSGAAVLVVAVPDPVVARLVVSAARSRWPRVPVVVRTHTTRERAELRRQGATAVVGEMELGLEMTRSAVRHLGVSAREADALVAGLRSR